MKRITMFLGAGILILTSMVYAAVPQLINFQGILRDGSGNPVANSSYSVVFTIYDAPSGGNVSWAETTSVSTASGLFTTLLGADNPMPDSVFIDSSRYLGIKVGADPEMTPRQRLSSVGYSYNSSEWTSAGQNLFRLNGNVGIGTVAPAARLDIQTSSGTGVISSSYDALGIGVQTFGPLYGVHATASSPFGGIGVYGSSDFFGVRGVGNGSSSSPIYGCGGVATNSSTGDAYGGYFSANSTSGTGYGVYGTSSSGYGGFFSGIHGVYGTGTSGQGVYGASTSGTGVYGVSSSGTGVYAYSSFGLGITAGGGTYAVEAVGTTRGVSATASSGPGVVATGSTNGVEATGGTRGVYATGGSYGVVGAATNNGGAGIYGSDNGNLSIFAGFFSGDVRVVGDFDVVSGTKNAGVKIDNGEYRRLYAQESPENWFEDFGTAQLVNGKAIVNLDPLYLQTVNTAIAYHVFLTPEGDSRGLYVTGKTPTSFEIREQQNGKSDLSVSYRIVAKRKGYENVRLAKLTGKTPEEVQAEDAKLRAQMAEERTKLEQEQLKMEAERKQMEEQRAKMEQGRVIQEQKK